MTTNLPDVMETSEDLSVDELKRVLPATLRSHATQSLADKINNAASDPEVARNIRENFVSYATILKDGRYKTEDYLSAVSYVSYKLMGYNNQDAYTRTFPKRYERLVAGGKNQKDISSYVAAYHKNKLVNAVMEQTLVPTWVLNQDLQQKAINQLAHLMVNAASEKVQSDSAIGLLAAIKKPDTKEINLNLGVQESAGLKELNESLTKMAEAQQQLIAAGQTTKQIASQTIFTEIEEAEFVNVESDSQT